MHFHGVSFGSQHEIWSKQHNGKVSWVPLMRISAIACARTLPSCMPVVSVSIRSIPRKPTLCCLRRCVSFVVALTKRSWMNSSPFKLPPPWTKGWSVRLISSSIPFRVNKAANASPMPPHCIRHKKSARAHRPHRAAEQPPDHPTPKPSPKPEARPHQGHAQLWPPLSRSRSRLRDAGASHRTTAPCPGGTHQNLGLQGPRAPRTHDNPR